MKKNIVVSVALISMVLFVSMLYVVDGLIETEPKSRGDEKYYKVRVGAESDMIEQAGSDANKLLEALQKNTISTDEVEQKIKENISYCLAHFAELQNGDDTDLEVVKKINYSLGYIYIGVINSDYDGGYNKSTKKETRLRKTLINKYVRAAFGYAGDCASLTQKEEDFENAEMYGKQISENLDKEISLFVGALSEVVAEANENGWIQKE